MDIPTTTLERHRGGFRLSAADLNRLALKSDSAGLRRAATHFGALLLTSVALIWALTWALNESSSTVAPTIRLLLLVPLLVLHGYLLAFLFSAEHECAHQTAFRRRWLNLLVGHVAAWLQLLPYEYYRAFHWDHHRFTQNRERDPELAAPLPTTLTGLFWSWSGLPGWRMRISRLIRHGLQGQVNEPWVPAAKRALVVAEARLYLIGYLLAIAGSLILQSTLLLWLWVLPMLIGYGFLRPYLLSEHTGCAETPALLENTRTTYTNSWVRLFAWNMPFHTEHHAYPAVPFHALPALHEMMAGHLVQTSQGYIAAWRGVCRYLLRRSN